MRSIKANSGNAISGSPDPDQTTRARIRDAAIDVFGRDGFRAGIRAIASEADVSTGLVNHHFGSKEGLRAECDAHVMELVRIAKSQALQDPNSADLIRQLAEVEDFAPLIAYVVRGFQHGGSLASSLFEQMVATTEQYLADGVAAGTLVPSRDPAARARYLTMQSLGGTLLYLQLRAERDHSVDFRQAIRDLTDEIMPPALELFTEGLLADRTFLDTVSGSATVPETTESEESA